jgi:hypothetical protein
MASLSGFDASKVEPNDFGVIPAGDYEACICNSELKATKDGTGEYLNLEIQIVGGQYQNRKLFEKLNLRNKNEQAVQIAKGTLSAICRAVGVLTPNDSSELHNKTFRISVGVRKSDYSGEMENRIKGFKPRSAQPVSSVTSPAAEYATTAPTQAKPW